MEQYCNLPHVFFFFSLNLNFATNLIFQIFGFMMLIVVIYLPKSATPHLGVSSHTYITLPRSIERGVAYAIGDTGKDLFRFPPIGGENSNDLIFEMGTNYKTFLEPLSAFRKRILYANAF